MQEPTLSYLSNEDRLKAYNAIVGGCNHVYSKGKLQHDKLAGVLSIFIQLAEHDPYFLAHFASYAVKNLESKDLKVIAAFANSLSDADGTPFITGTDAQGKPIYSPTYKKPNLRLVSQAAVQEFDPKLVNRIIEIANLKQSIGTRREATHFANSLKTAIRKWIHFREQNPKALEGMKKSGFAPTFKNIYRMMHMKPSQEAAEILGWRQGSAKKGNVEKIEKRNLIDFKGLSDIQIAQKIRDEKIPVLGAMGALPDKISPVVAAAILEQASGNQAVILRNLFDSQGLLKDKEVMKVFTEKVQTAKTALDRVEKLKTTGGSVLLKVEGLPLLFVRESEETIRGVDPTCTHRKCTVEYNKNRKQFICPCHGSRYDLEGKVLKGPAEKPLKNLNAHLESGRIVFSLGETND